MALGIWWHITPKKNFSKHQTINLARKTKTTQKQFPFHRSNPKTKPFIQVNITIIALTPKRQRWLLSRTKKEENCFFSHPNFPPVHRRSSLQWRWWLWQTNFPFLIACLVSNMKVYKVALCMLAPSFICMTLSCCFYSNCN